MDQKKDSNMFHRIESFESNVSGVSATSSEIVGVLADKEIFESISTVQDLQQMTIAFLNGDMQATSYHFAPLLKESAPLVDQLIAINEAGFITTGSQPGGVEWVGKGRRIQKRTFVEGILKRRYFSQFLREMYVRLGNNCFISQTDTEMCYEQIQDLQKSDLYWVSRNEGEQHGFLHIPEVTGPCQMFQTCDEIYPQLVEEYVSVFILDTRWGFPATALLSTIYEVLIQLVQRSIQNAPMSKSQ